MLIEASAARNIPSDIMLPFSPVKLLHRSIVTTVGHRDTHFHRFWLATPDECRHILSHPEGVDPFATGNNVLLDIAGTFDNQVTTHRDGQDGTVDVFAMGCPVNVTAP